MSKRTVRDYPAEYFDIWQLATKGKLSLEFPSKGHATNKKVDLQRFRKRLSEESPELAEQFFQVDLLVKVNPAELGAQLVDYVPDWKKQIRRQVATSNLTSAAVVEIAHEILEQKNEETQDQVAETLAELGFKAPS